MKIYIANDHAGYDLKLQLIENLKTNHDIEDLGTNSSESVDFPDYAHELALSVAKNKFENACCP